MEVYAFFSPLKYWIFFHENVRFYNWGVTRGRIMPKLIVLSWTLASDKRQEPNSDTLAVPFSYLFKALILSMDVLLLVSASQSLDDLNSSKWLIAQEFNGSWQTACFLLLMNHRQISINHNLVCLFYFCRWVFSMSHLFVKQLIPKAYNRFCW